MKVGELKKLIQEFPDELEVAADWPEKDSVTLSGIYRARVEDVAVEETADVKPVLYPVFEGKQVLCLKFVKKRSF